MNMNIGKRILRLVTPRSEQARMDMRDARCRAEASAEDLTRTIDTHGDTIQTMIKRKKPERGQ